MLEIRAPRIFAHAGVLPPQLASRDPRDPDFLEDAVRIDLSDCDFVYPPAVLWCAVYAALVRRLGVACELLVPVNRGVASYLKAVGLFSTLAEIGVGIDEQGISPADKSQIVLPLSRFSSISESECLAGDVIRDKLSSSGKVAGNLNSIISDAFAELGNNVAQHADSPIGAAGVVQFYDTGQGQQVWCVVADGGQGIRASMSKNRELSPYTCDEWTAIGYALRENVSRTGATDRGFGLFQIARDYGAIGQNFIIHSGRGEMVLTKQTKQSKVTFPGTLSATKVLLKGIS